jgi:hypothetical protein
MGEAVKLKELLARVESATGADRGLDALIEVHVAPSFGDLAMYKRPAAKAGCVTGRYRGGRSGTYNSPEFSNSLDHSLYLVGRLLPGWSWLVHGPRMSLGHEASLTSDDYRVVVGKGANGPLALLAATLRALLQIEERKADPTRLALAQKDSQP